jgi:hypothetical protein
MKSLVMTKENGMMSKYLKFKKKIKYFEDRIAYQKKAYN